MPQARAELEAEISLIDGELDGIDAALRTLLAAEDPATGVFYAQDIHTLRQKKLILMTRRELRQTRIRRILAGQAI